MTPQGAEGGDPRDADASRVFEYGPFGPVPPRYVDSRTFRDCKHEWREITEPPKEWPAAFHAAFQAWVPSGDRMFECVCCGGGRYVERSSKGRA